MSTKEEAHGTLRRLLRRRRVVQIAELYDALETRSRMTVFRRLREVGYRTSYTHPGRFYTLTDIPDFDEWGLWFCRDVGFSEAGTLKQTVASLLEAVPDGRTHAEFKHLLHVRMHNTLLELVREGRIGRERYEGALLYVSADPERAAEQVRRRREGDLAISEIFGEPTVQETIEVLAEALRGAAEIPPPSEVAKRLAARGVQVGPRRVQRVYASLELVPGKKTVPPT